MKLLILKRAHTLIQMSVANIQRYINGLKASYCYSKHDIKQIRQSHAPIPNYRKVYKFED